MKRLSILTLALLAAAAISSCTANREQEEPLRGEPILFSSSIGDFTVKATDKAFENGDVAGLYALEPVNVSDIKLTWADGAFTPSETIYWGRGQTESTTFVAWYPYDIKATHVFNPLTTETLTVNTDQSKLAVYKAQDLLGAVSEASPGETVHLAFSHQLSKLCLVINSDHEIASVKVEGLVSGYAVNLVEGTLKSMSNAAAAEVYTPYYIGNNAWTLITPPQTTVLRVICTTADGKEIAFSSSDPTTFEPGKQVFANAIIFEDDTVTFSSEILDWGQGPTIYLSNEEDLSADENYYLVISDRKEEIQLTKNDDGTYSALVYAGDKDNPLSSAVNIRNEDGSLFLGVEEEVSVDGDSYTYLYSEHSNPVYFNPLYGYGSFEVTFAPSKRTIYFTEFEFYGWGSVLESNITIALGLPAAEWEVPYFRTIDGNDIYQVYDLFRYSPYTQYLEIEYSRAIILNGTNPDAAFIGTPSYAGLSNNNTVVMTESYVSENGWNVSTDYHGTFYNGEFTFPVRGLLHTANGSWYLGNPKGHTTFVLPGYSRTSVYPGLESSLTVTPKELEDGTKILSAGLVLFPDNSLLRLGVFDGYIESDLAEQTYNILSSGGEPSVPFETWAFNSQPVPGADVVTSYYIPYDKTGKVTVYAYVEGTDGTTWYMYWHRPYVPAGADAPACEFSVSSPILSEISPESTASIVLRGEDIWYAYVCALTPDEKESLEYSGALEQFVQSAGTYYGISSAENYTIQVSGMEADTDYYIVVMAYNIFSNSSIQSVAVHTAAESNWQSLGMGTYIDFGAATFVEKYADGYYSSVEILYDPAVEGKYRVVNPYGEFWSDADEEQVALQGKPQSEYFDFYTVEEDGVNYVFFSDICTGLKVSSLANDDPEDWTATMIYQHLSNGAERLADDAYACNSKQVGDGVFHLAPWNFIYGTNYYYSWYQYDSDVAYVVLPGHSLDELSGAPRLLKAKGGISNTLSTTPKQVRNN